jgi:hypothetical protein
MKYKMCFNLEKCTFGFQTGKVLVFYLTKQGIEVTPNKCCKIANLTIPLQDRNASTNPKQDAHYTVEFRGKIIPTRSSSSFQTSTKRGHIRMDRGMQHDTSTFEASLIQNFGLTSPRARRGPISIVVTSKAINTTLIWETTKRQKYVYFTSKGLQGIENKYQQIEEVALLMIFKYAYDF